MVVVLFLQQLLQRVTQEKHSGHAELIAKFCLMQFSRSGGEHCVVASSVPVLCAELQ